jgi:hypothetical protein
MNLFYNILFILIISNNIKLIKCFFNRIKINNFTYKNYKKNKINQYLYSENVKYTDIYKKYEKYAIYKALEFKTKYKMRIINNEELFMYSKMGLYKAIINYNYNFNHNFNHNTSFYNYLQKYIYGELYNYVTDSYPITMMPKYLRKSNNYNSIENKKHKILPLLVQNYWYFDKIKNQENKYEHVKINEIWKIIYSNLDHNSLLIFKNKYDYNFNVKKSNLNISKSLGYNEEYIRLNLIKSKNIIKNILEER